MVVVVVVVVIVVVVVVVVVVVPVNGLNKTRWSSGRQFCFVSGVWGLPLGPEFSMSVISVDIDINSDYGDIARVRNVCFWLCFDISEHLCVQSIGPY